MMTNKLKELFELYAPKAGDEQRFVGLHTIETKPDRNGNGDDVFKATNIKTIERASEKHGYDTPKGIKAYDAKKATKVKGEFDEEVEELDERSSSSFHFTHIPGDEESEEKLANLKAKTRGTGKRVVLKGRLGKDNPNAEKYQLASRKAGTYPTGGHAYQNIAKADAKHFDVYTYNEEVEDLDEGNKVTLTQPVETHQQIHAGQLVKSATGRKVYFDGSDMVDHKSNKTIMRGALSGEHNINKLISSTKGFNEEVEELDEIAYEKDLEDNEPRKVQGVYGMKSKSFEKKFKNQSAQDKFFEHPDREGNYEVHYVSKMHEDFDEEVEDLDEVSKKTLGSYIKAAAEDAEQAGRDQEHYGNINDYNRGTNRKKGISRAVSKLTKEESEPLEELSKDKITQHLTKRLKRDALEGGKQYPDPTSFRNAIKSVSVARQKAGYVVGKNGEPVKVMGTGKASSATKNAYQDVRRAVSKKYEEVESIGVELLDEGTMKLDKVNIVHHYDHPDSKAFAREYVNANKPDYMTTNPSDKDLDKQNDFYEKYSRETTRTGFAGSGTHVYRNRKTGQAFKVDKHPNGKTFYGTDHMITHMTESFQNEEAEGLDELSKSKLSSYIDKAEKSSDELSNKVGDDAWKKMHKRDDSVLKAKRKWSTANEETELEEKLSPNATAADYIDDFVHSDDPRFAGKSKEKRKQMALAAFYAKTNEEVEEIMKGKDPCWKGYQMIGTKEKGGRKVPNCVTKEDVVTRALNKYLPELNKTPMTNEEILESKIKNLPEKHIKLILNLFDSLTEENQYIMLESVETSDGINKLLDFAINNRGA